MSLEQSPWGGKGHHGALAMCALPPLTFPLGCRMAAAAAQGGEGTQSGARALGRGAGGSLGGM